MESLYNGRAAINDALSHLKITIPTRKVYFFIIVFSIWLIPMLLGGALGMIAAFVNPYIPTVAALIMLVFWAAIVTFVGRFVWWMIAGKEIIEIDKKVLQISHKGLLFSKPKVYDIDECKNFRTIDNIFANTFPMSIRSNTINIGSTGTIAFDYGMKTIKFANAIDEAEGRYIINLLKERNILTLKNF